MAQTPSRSRTLGAALVGGLARRSRSLTQRAGATMRRLGGKSSVIRLSQPTHDAGAWGDEVEAKAQRLAQWMRERRAAGQESVFFQSEFAPSVMQL